MTYRLGMSQPYNTKKESLDALRPAELLNSAHATTSQIVDAADLADTIPEVAPHVRLSDPMLAILGITEERVNRVIEEARVLEAQKPLPSRQALIKVIRQLADVMMREHNAEFLCAKTILNFLKSKGEALTKHGTPMRSFTIGDVLGAHGLNLPWVYFLEAVAVGKRRPHKYYALTLVNSPEDQVRAAKEALDKATPTELQAIRRA